MVSIIIVSYKVEKELISCISSIIESKPKVFYEIIAVDNGSGSNLKEALRKIPQVQYIKSAKNIGFGAGNNLGSKHASGAFLFFLNPDTIVQRDSIDILFNFIKNNSNSGMVAPLLLDPSGNVYSDQGSDEYNFGSAVIVSSFINKIFPNNSISSKFFHKQWNKKKVEEFDVVPGTAFMISKSVFERSGMFDEKFFLYFEEYDLAKRVKNLGYRNYIIPKSKVTHIWEASTKKRKDINRIFSQSRYLFFKKHHGILFASIVNLVSSIGKYEFILSLIIVISAFLGFFKIKELMTFIGDQGWFYTSARDIFISGQIPLVGIASSHPWLHQGPLWTYLLAVFLLLFNFDPVSGAYLSIILGVLAVVGIYIVGLTLFSKRVGLIASLLYSTSPLAVYYIRFPYHTSPISFLVIALIFSLYKIIQNKMIYLPFAVFLLSVLYNFEIATVVLWVVLIGILTYKFFKDRKIFLQMFNKKIIFFSLFLLLVPLLPIILYDIRNGFPQTLKFFAWIFYRVFSLFGYSPQHEFSIDKIIIMLSFLFNNFTKLIFASSNSISLIIFISIIGWVVYYIFQKKERDKSHNLVFVLYFVPLLLIVLNQTPSDAYLPILFPTGILILSLFCNRIMQIRKLLIPALVLIFIIVFGNIYSMFKNDFAFDKSSRMFALDKRLQTANEILNIVGNKDYNLKGRGPGSEHESFTMNYEYLTWWLGHAPSKKNKLIKIYVSESANGIKVENK